MPEYFSALGTAMDNLHLAKLSRFTSLFFFCFSEKIFSPTMPASATPSSIYWGMSSSRKKSGHASRSRMSLGSLSLSTMAGASIKVHQTPKKKSLKKTKVVKKKSPSPTAAAVKPQHKRKRSVVKSEPVFTASLRRKKHKQGFYNIDNLQNLVWLGTGHRKDPIIITWVSFIFN